MAMIHTIALAGMLALAMPLPAHSAGQSGKTLLVITQAAGDRESATAGKRVRSLIMESLARRGHTVLDGLAPAAVPGAAVLRVTTIRNIIRGTYVSTATIGLRVSLVDGDTKRSLAQFDLGPEGPWRVSADCQQSCIDQEFERRVRLLVARLADDVDRRLQRFHPPQDVSVTDPAVASITFRGIDPTLLPQIEQYLQNFPGVIQVRRDERARSGILYRLTQDGIAGKTELSLRKMLLHLELKARIGRNGNSYLVEVDPKAEPAAASQDW